jgi:hypothetical protein
MLFAPQNDEIVPRVFAPGEPTADTIAVYRRARDLAEEYWDLISKDSRASTESGELLFPPLHKTLHAAQRPPTTAAHSPYRVQQLRKD